LLKADGLLSEARNIGPVLGLDSGGASAGAALVDRGRVLASSIVTTSSYSAGLPMLVQEVLDQGGIGFSDLTAVAIAVGPGSFTGLRIGVSYAKGLATANGCSIVGVSSLDAMAVGALDLADLGIDLTLCPIIDARKNELYAALYRTMAAGVEKLTTGFIVRPEDLAGRIRGEAIFFSDGPAAHAKLLNASFGERTRFLTEIPNRRAIAVAALGAARVATAEIDNVLELQPSYVRPPEAAVSKSPDGLNSLTEALWSGEKKSSSSNTLLMMKN